MKKSNFTNHTIYWAIISLIGGLLLWNLYATFTTGRLIGILPITIQAILLGLIFTKSQYAKIGIKIWSIIFLAVASGLQFVGKLLQDLTEGFSNFDAVHYLTTGITILLGVLIVVYTNKTVEIVDVEN